VLRALEAAYRDGSWGKYHGRHVERLERRLAEGHAVEFALTCGSGTFAVELALRALKIGPGDEVILSAYDYPGNFLTVHALGARPVLVDVDPDNWNLDPGRLADAVSPTTRAVIASHLHGGMVPMREVMAVAAGHRLKVVEDAAQATGGVVQGRRAGTWGDVGVLSFGGSKLLTAGRGGAIMTRHADVRQRARLWLQRGNHVCPLSELQAAVLAPQLDKLTERTAQRRASALYLSELLRDLPGLRPLVNHTEPTVPGYYKMGFQYDGEAFGLSRDVFVAAARAEGVAIDEGFRGLHVSRSPGRFRAAGDLGEATRAHHGTVVLHHPILLGGLADIDEVAGAFRKVYANAERLRTGRG
jgi:dTDP-4-amino-4,6-dideoxygalactose transaminase